ncbi:DNA integrity scanning protein DisA nucleotide-binding domain protein [Candidatus Pacearchaeota archaeon]|nr:DNA integrity scanning protein DisA nucleotide-binding domain protein [Candidatus Pacearchaeota archaeon]
MAEEISKELKETLIQVGLRIAKRGEGALIIMGEVKYKPLVEQSIPPFNVINNPKLLESLALIDGAVILDREGNLVAYGAMIKSTKIMKNYGTRHSAAISSSKKENFVLLVSEEDRKVKILKDEKMIMQIDALQKNVEKSIPAAVNILESVGAGTIGALGTSLLLPALGLYFLPGVIVFGSAYYLAKHLKRIFRRRE